MTELTPEPPTPRRGERMPDPAILRYWWQLREAFYARQKLARDLLRTTTTRRVTISRADLKLLAGEEGDNAD